MNVPFPVFLVFFLVWFPCVEESCIVYPQDLEATERRIHKIGREQGHLRGLDGGGDLSAGGAHFGFSANCLSKSEDDKFL